MRDHTQRAEASLVRVFLFVVERVRHPQFRRSVQQAKIGRRDADNRIAVSVHGEALTQGAGVASESPLPQAMAQQCHAIVPGLRLLRKKRAALRGLYAQKIERARRDKSSLHSFRKRPTGEYRRLRSQSRDLVEGPALFHPVPIVRR